MQPGFIYFLVNEAMPGLVKVGYTTQGMEERVRQLSSTGTPRPFQVVATFYVSDPENCEKAVHAALSPWRLSKEREFFSGSPAQFLGKALPEIIPFLLCQPEAPPKAAVSSTADQDDIYFMTFLLHDGYESGVYIETTKLAEHHSKYAPLELEYKLLKLAEKGMVERARRQSAWRITPAGVKFMFDTGNVLHDLIVDQRPKHRNFVLPSSSSV
jgi:hypothetical protein